MREKRFFGNPRTAQLHALIERVRKLSTDGRVPRDVTDELLERLASMLSENELPAYRGLHHRLTAACR